MYVCMYDPLYLATTEADIHNTTTIYNCILMQTFLTGTSWFLKEHPQNCVEWLWQKFSICSLTSASETYLLYLIYDTL